MKLKSTLIAALCCLSSLSAFAHRDYYYDYTFTDVLADGWTVTNGSGEGADGMYIVYGDGNGSITYSQTLTDVVAIPALEGCQVTVIHQGNDNTYLRVILTGTDGTSCTLGTGSALPNDGEVTTVAYASVLESGTKPADVSTIQIVLDGSGSESVCVVSDLLVQSNWDYPTVNTSKAETRIQAEDFDEGGLEVGYSTVITSPSSAYRKDNPYISFCGPESIYDGGYGISNCGENWSSYELSDPLTVETAKKNWGQWTKYTINVEEDCTVDITIGAGTHLGSYQLISVLGCYNSSTMYFNDLGYSFNWVERYSASWVMSIDDENIRGTQTKRFSYGGGGEDVYGGYLADESNFYDTQITLSDGTKVNNDTIWIWPTLNNAQNSYSSWAPQTFDQPHYQGVNLTKGTHVIKIQSLASQWAFDYISIVPTGGGSVEGIKATETAALKVYPNPATSVIKFSKQLDYTICNLNGATVLSGSGTEANVSDLANGLYIVRTGDGQAAKFIKK